MARKHLIYSYKMFDAVSMATNQTSNAVNVAQLDEASIYISWSSSSIVGVITVQAQNGDDGTWYTLDFNDTITINVDNSYVQIVLSEMPFTSIRLVYTATSGTGTMNAVITSKSKGA